MTSLNIGNKYAGVILARKEFYVDERVFSVKGIDGHIVWVTETRELKSILDTENYVELLLLGIERYCEDGVIECERD